MYRLLASALILLTLCGFRPAPPMAAGPVALSLVDRDTGDELASHPHRGQQWVAGTPGHCYGVRLRNLTGERVLVVLSVDGVNAISGETAAPEQAGYVLEPWQSSEIAGWRKSSAEVAQFVFTDLGNSYASRTGRPANVGVVGIAVFREARPVAPAPAPMPRRPAPVIAEGARADRAMAAEAKAAREETRDRQQLGTGHGEREWSATRVTDFERASRAPAQVSEIRYDARSRLVALGILPRHRVDTAPRAFPGGFVPDPPARMR